MVHERHPGIEVSRPIVDRSADSTLLPRRAFLASAAGAVALALVPGCSTGTHVGDGVRRALLRMARLLYPHDALDDAVYADVLRPLLARADRSDPFAAELRAGVAALDAGGSWLAATPERQVEALARIQGSAFFDMVRTAVRTRLYEHPAVWRLIGFEGPSVGFGGYLERGFDEAGWLPET